VGVMVGVEVGLAVGVGVALAAARPFDGLRVVLPNTRQ
jgi:hypothetical protein